MKKLLIVWVAGCTFWGAPGCTRQAWYEGFREQQRQACYRYAGQDEVRRCLDRVDSMTFEQYMRTREETSKQAGDDENR